jgi:hypothetical protein
MSKRSPPGFGSVPTDQAGANIMRAILIGAILLVGVSAARSEPPKGSCMPGSLPRHEQTKRTSVAVIGLYNSQQCLSD